MKIRICRSGWGDAKKNGFVGSLCLQHPEVDRTWGTEGICYGAFKDHSLSTPGWLHVVVWIPSTVRLWPQLMCKAFVFDSRCVAVAVSHAQRDRLERMSHNQCYGKRDLLRMDIQAYHGPYYIAYAGYMSCGLT